MAMSNAARQQRLRARRREALEADPGAPLRDAAELVSPALEESLSALDLDGKDAAVVALARSYARVLDTSRDPAWSARWVGPLFLDALTALGATPAAKAALAKGQQRGQSGPSKLDELRMRRVSVPRHGV